MKADEARELAEAIVLAEEIRDGEVSEVSAVDQPATARRFTMFKNANGPGFGDPPVDGYETCLARGDQSTPATCEGGTDEDHDLSLALEADVAGHDLEHTYAHAKAVPEGADRATFDRCVEDVMASIESGDLVPDDPDADPKSTAFAICTAGGAGKGLTMSQKTGAPSGAPTMPDQVIDIPPTPTEADREEIVAAGTAQGLTSEQAESAFKAVHVDYGAPWDADLVLVPQGVKADELVRAAANSLGFAKMASTVTLKGHSHWSERFKSFLGFHAKPQAAKLLTKHIREVNERLEGVATMQEKSNADLRYVVDRLISESATDRRLLREALGLEVQDPEKEPEPAPAPVQFPAKRQKDEPAIPGDQPAGSPEYRALDERMGRLENAVGQILGALGVGGDATPAPVAEPAKRVSVPPTPAPARRFGTKSISKGAHVFSTMCDGYLPAADRAEAQVAMGIPHLARR